MELLGRNRLIGELLKAGIEVAIPIRDRGTDLILYLDKDFAHGRFSGVPLQIKCSTQSGFGIHKKYESFPDLVIVHLWNVESLTEYRSFATTYSDSLAIAERTGWTKTRSWTQKGGYDCTKPGKQLRELLQPFEMNAERWKALVRSHHRIAT